jgi:hypothetical protein
MQRPAPTYCTPLCLVTAPPVTGGAEPARCSGGGGDGAAAAPSPLPAPPVVAAAAPPSPPHHQEVRVAGARTASARGATVRVVASLGPRVVADAPATIGPDGLR